MDKSKKANGNNLLTATNISILCSFIVRVLDMVVFSLIYFFANVCKDHKHHRQKPYKTVT